MKNIILKLKNENGAAEIIEMTLIFPFVVVILGFLIYLSAYIYNCVNIYNNVQRVAVIASREDAYPGYEQLYNFSNEDLTNRVDFKSDIPLGKDVVNNIMKIHEPYRYLFGGSLSETETGDLEKQLKTMISKQGVVSNSNISCDISENSNIISKNITVNVKQKFAMPGFLKFIGVTEPTVLDVTVQAASQDNSEFVRNTDIVCDICSNLYNNLSFGKSSKTLSQRVSNVKQKFDDARNKMGWK